MAEAVGAIASIIGIISAGAKLSIILFDFASSIGSSGTEVRAIAIEISLFCSVLQQLERTLAKAKDRRYSISAIETTQRILDQCQFIFSEIDSIVRGLQKHKSSPGDVSVDFKARVKWIFKKSTVQMHRATLESCKITLHLMLTTLDFAQRISARKMSTAQTEIEDEQEQMVTQSLVTAQHCAVDALAKLEQQELKDLDSLGHEKDTLGQIQEHSGSTEAPVPCGHLSGSIAQRERTSIWLGDLLAQISNPSNSRRISTSRDASKYSQLPNLLWKWTDQGEHWDQMHEATLPKEANQCNHEIGPRSESVPEYEHAENGQDFLSETGSFTIYSLQSSTNGLRNSLPRDYPLSPTSPTSPKTARNFDSIRLTAAMNANSVAMTPPPTPGSPLLLL